jgi:exodeoxyribonuclease VII small subunit
MEKNAEANAEKFEKSLERLQSVVRELEGGELPLEESLRKFEEGMSLAKGCQERLNQAEQRIEILVRADKDGVKTKAFEPQEK